MYKPQALRLRPLGLQLRNQTLPRRFRWSLWAALRTPSTVGVSPSVSAPAVVTLLLALAGDPVLHTSDGASETLPVGLWWALLVLKTLAVFTASLLTAGEVMLGDLFRSGFDIVEDHEDADAIVVNTCSFVEEAKTESLEVLHFCSNAALHPASYLICLQARCSVQLLDSSLRQCVWGTFWEQSQ